MSVTEINVNMNEVLAKVYRATFRQYRGIVSPDFSMYVGMPKAMQIFQVYRQAFLTAYYQQWGIKVIPSVIWAEPDTFDWCFSWIPKGSAVVVSTVGCVQNKDARRGFLVGFERMLEEIEPSEIVFFHILTSFRFQQSLVTSPER